MSVTLRRDIGFTLPVGSLRCVTASASERGWMANGGPTDRDRRREIALTRQQREAMKPEASSPHRLQAEATNAPASNPADEPRFHLAQLDSVPAVPCPCGLARRAFGHIADAPASVRLVEVKADAAVHYHRRMTELYVVLEGDGEIELDGQRFPVQPLTAVLIKPGCRHRAIGTLKLLNIPIPPFDPADEWFD